MNGQAGALGGSDVRLALGTGVAWLTLVVVADRGLAAALWSCAAAAVLAAVGLVAASRGQAFGTAVALAGCCVLLVLVPFAGRLARARASPLTALAASAQSVTLRLTLSGDPSVLASKGTAGLPRVAVDTDADAVELTGRWTSVDGAVLVLAPATGWQQLLPGQQVQVDGTLLPPLDSGQAGVVLSARGPPIPIGRPPWWQRLAGVVRADLRRSCSGLPDEVRGLLPGLIDGDISGLDPVLAQRFKTAGLTHLVAVSGTNLSILLGTALLLLRQAGVRRRVCVVAGLVVIAGFVVVARPSPSVLRAAVMGAVALFGLASGRRGRALPVLSAAVLALLVAEPDFASDAGFTMSVLATGAIVAVAPGCAAWLRAHRVPGGLAEALAVATAANLVTAPVIAELSGRVSLVSIPANLLAEPVVAAATVLGFLAAAVAPLSLGLGASLAWLAGWPTRWLVWVADTFGGLHGATVPWPGGVHGALALAGAIAGLVLLARRAGLRRVLAAGVVVALAVQVPARTIDPSWPPPGWVFIACDVGQGDGLVLNAGPHAVVEVDAGPDPVAIDRCLRDLGVTAIPLLIFTHYHLDHVGGIAGAIRDRRLGRVMAGPLTEPYSGVLIVDSALASRGLRVTSPAPGDVIDVGAVHLLVLGPSAPFHGTRSDPNNSSLVIMATVHGVRILLSGDAEVEAQDAVLSSGADLHADVLKVPHHGSAYSDPRYLAASHAQVGVISVGAHNDYGHPAPLLLHELAALGMPVRRTDREGDVAVAGTPGRLTVVSHGRAASVPGS